ncbi:hypothetical protein [Pseudotamlana carrageenivorans]|uniref:Uncharacterized protein n=1 Tax=Pseudotamlana carrageenivorans TaxID=2069432 RepID=A0A2I7SHG0_9FLAO|nr:hypothetical protein [Tamlana carrageenivorans]AUS05336.1 hypothetical protein C1A40_07535 [Tamlana carrageenivorans]
MHQRTENESYRPITSFERRVFIYLQMLSKFRKADMYGMAPAVANLFMVTQEKAENLLVQWLINFREDGEYALVYVPKSLEV